MAPVPGDVVMAHDGRVGRIATVLRSEDGRPRYAVVATGRVVRRYPVVPCELILGVDGAHRIVRVRGNRRTIRRMPQRLPMVL